MSRSFHVTKRHHLRDFVWTLVRTDFKGRYQGAASGFLWALLKPLAMFIVLYAVFSFLFTDRTYVYNLMLGLTLFNFFGEATRDGMESLHRKGYLLTKAPFPRWIVVLTSMANALLTLFVCMTAILLAISIAWRVPTLATGALFLLYLVLYFLIVVGFSLGTSVLFLKYRDLNQVWDVIMQAGFFFAPIIYKIDILPEKYHFFLYLWPVTPVIQFSRQVLVLGQVPTLRAHLLLFGVTGVMLVTGLVLFRKHAPSAVEKL
jgi:lipopolysaccharide transport system permease protein